MPTCKIRCVETQKHLRGEGNKMPIKTDEFYSSLCGMKNFY